MFRRPPSLVRALISRCEASLLLARRRWVLLSHAGITLGQSVAIARGVQFKVTDCGQLQVGDRVSIARGVEIHAQNGALSIGKNCFIGSWTSIVACDSVQIGQECLIAERVTIRDQDHSIHGALDIPINGAGLSTSPIRIGDGVWIAAGAVILKGSAIGEGAVIAANAVVRGEVPPRAIVGGVPARILGFRRG